MNRYYKNFILCGELDYYCLLCEESFELTEQVEKHIRWENHRKIIKNLAYDTKYRKEFIFKIGNYYYCEICNYVTTSGTVNIHIKEDKHLLRKEIPSTGEITSDVKRNKNGLVNYYDMTMSKLEWHGIVNNHCVLCKTPIGNVEHINETDHMIALIQSKMMTINDNEYYRKINDNTLYCFSCNKFFEKGSSHNHDSKGQNIKNEIEKNESANKAATSKHQDGENDILTLLEKQRKYFYINLEKNTATCIQCKLTLPDIKLKSMIGHRKAHITENEEDESSDDSDNVTYFRVTDHGKRRSEIAKYGKKHFIKLNCGGSKGYCFLCDSYISAHLNVAKEHVRGSRHQGLLLAKGLKKGNRYDKQQWDAPEKKPLHAFIKQMLHAEHLKVICINKSLCMDILSFLLVLPIDIRKIKCLSCDEIVETTEIEQHSGTKDHKVKFMAASVMIIDYDPLLVNEFVREVQPDVYHCGFCNQLFPYWDSTHLHLKSFKHQQAKRRKEVICSLAQQYIDTNSIYVSSKKRNTLLQKLSKLGLF